MTIEIYKEQKYFASLKGYSRVIQQRNKPICDISCLLCTDMVTMKNIWLLMNYALHRDYHNKSPCWVTVIITHVISQVLLQLWQLFQDLTDQNFSKLVQLRTLHSPICHLSLHRRHHRLLRAERQRYEAVLLWAETACLLQISRTSKTKEISTKYESFSNNFLRIWYKFHTCKATKPGSLVFTLMGISAGFSKSRSVNDVITEFAKEERKQGLNFSYICCIGWAFNPSLFVKM